MNGRGFLKRAYDGATEMMREGGSETDGSEIDRKKKRFWVILIAGLVFCVTAFVASLCISSGGIIPVSDTLGSLVSAINKGGTGLTMTEQYVYHSRMPRALASVGVGAGLAVAGCVYQALIRNPLVDPYITGVSSGAGCFAIAGMTIGASIPFIGAHSTFFVPLLAIIGGLLAFSATMLVAESAGGNAMHYILAGVTVGFAFSSLMAVFMTERIETFSNVMDWLYGSFVNVTWDTVFVILVPALGISVLAMLWAREFNLFSVGEEQAKQLGLNVRAFKVCMMVLASVLTAVCVAFVGIIGFVGLIIPHACRMFLGGDHRLIMPASMVLGSCLMLFSDILARVVISPMEVPVGAITALIGAPIFVLMLVMWGRKDVR